MSLREQLIQAEDGSMEGDELRLWLKRLQGEFLVRMAAIDAEAAAALAKEQEESIESNQEVEFNPSEDLEQQGLSRLKGSRCRWQLHPSENMR